MVSIKPKETETIYRYHITKAGGSEDSTVLGTNYAVVSNGVLTVYMNRREVASFKRWQTIEIQEDTPQDPDSLLKKFNLLEMKMSALEKSQHRIASQAGNPGSVLPATGFPPENTLSNIEESSHAINPPHQAVTGPY